MNENPRFYVLSAERFDGTTPLSMGWLPNNNQNTPRHVVEQDLVGRLSFADLARPGTSGCVVLARRWSSEAEGDQVEVRSVSATETKDDPPTTVLDSLLEVSTLLSTWSRPLFLGPTDALAIHHLPEGGGTVELLVADEYGDLLKAHIQAAEAEALAGNSVTPLGTQTLLAAGQVEPVKNRDLLVLLTFETDGDVSLPALEDAGQGVRVTFLRVDGDGVPRIVLKTPATDTVNSVTDDPGFTPYVMRSLQDVVTYRRVPGGWIREQGTPAHVLVNETTSPIAVPPGVEGTLYVVSRVAGAAVATLPSCADCRVGYRIFFVNAGSAWLTPTPDGTDRINRSLAPYSLPAGASALFEVMTLIDWCAVAQDETPIPIESADASVDVPAWRGFGRQIVRVSNAAGVVNLPSTEDVNVGASCLVENTGTGVVTIDGDGADLINGHLTRAVPPGAATLLVMNGFSWTATGGDFGPQREQAVVGVTVLPSGTADLVLASRSFTTYGPNTKAKVSFTASGRLTPDENGDVSVVYRLRVDGTFVPGSHRVAQLTSVPMVDGYFSYATEGLVSNLAAGSHTAEIVILSATSTQPSGVINITPEGSLLVEW
ncbi:hypothetical protein SAMN02745121_08566 [Nannocystis exedens]|uniref:Uncharacterized protein n=1 Tax=Nannocystis exedens TaxID=54 RepID=A0A1I2IAT4_9BACT|nr:hypothetical protein [Nannocystis exedens]PCC73145.1 hypothetical protein NAEX_06233 [Nannocystis exedens]SFF39324.1 hypothetical protein SAMN02745121_08566 [Nannocystis exedens]